jgi:hypothetical protein
MINSLASLFHVSIYKFIIIIIIYRRKMPGPGVSKAIDSLAFYNDPDSSSIEMSRALYAEIEGERFKIVKKLIKDSSEI